MNTHYFTKTPGPTMTNLPLRYESGKSKRLLKQCEQLTIVLVTFKNLKVRPIAEDTRISGHKNWKNRKVELT